jgi:hypothetical protein
MTHEDLFALVLQMTVKLADLELGSGPPAPPSLFDRILNVFSSLPVDSESGSPTPKTIFGLDLTGTFGPSPTENSIGECLPNWAAPEVPTN